jgi:hypothetical protein
MTPLHASVVFLSSLIADVVWAKYTLATTAHHPLFSSLWAAAIIGIGVVSIDAYISSRLYVLPSAAGGALGTYLTVLHARTLAPAQP